MRKFLFTFILSSLTGLGFADSQLTDHVHEIDYSGQSDSFICSWFDVIPVPEDFINEAKKRGLTCGGITYKQHKETTTKRIPENAYASQSSSTGWKCYATYTKSGNSCIRLKIPANATVSGTGWKCNSGYYKNGNSCFKLPFASYSGGYGGLWSCFTNYYKDGSSCKRTPVNARANRSHTGGFTCNGGYIRSGNSCKKKTTVPENARAKMNTQGWQCISGYFQKNKKCYRLPPNAEAYVVPDNSDYILEGFRCKFGYKKSGNGCVMKKIAIPPNAYASGSGWKCNPGFERQGNSCNQIEDDTIYQAASGSGFATTKEGHILTNHHVVDGCSEVTLFKNGKSYLTTVITQDPKNDLAILQSDFKPTKVYPLTTEVYLSDDIFAAGFPFGKKISSAITINKGIISALMGPGDDISIFQIDADINSGNSGGPIVDRRGNAVGIAVMKLNAERAQEELKLGSTPEGFNFAVNSMMAIGLFRSQGIEIPPQNNNELSVKDRNDLFNHGTFYLTCGMTIAQYEKMIKTDKVMFTRDVFFSNFEGN